MDSGGVLLESDVKAAVDVEFEQKRLLCAAGGTITNINLLAKMYQFNMWEMKVSSDGALCLVAPNHGRFVEVCHSKSMEEFVYNLRNFEAALSIVVSQMKRRSVWSKIFEV